MHILEQKSQGLWLVAFGKDFVLWHVVEDWMDI